MMAFLGFGQTKRIYYELLDGAADHPYLVFLHEGLGCTGIWKDFPRRLCQETNCPGIVYDRMGYGKSSALDGPMTLHFMHFNAFIELREIISMLIPDRDFICIGHSDGGSISLIFASEKPRGLRGVITEGAHVFVERKTVDGIRVAVNDFSAGRLRGLNKYHGEKTDVLFKVWSDIWLSPGFNYWNIEYLLPSIECPLLVLQGIDDRYGTIAQAESIVSKMRNAQKIILDKCGHAPHHENADATLQAMKRFVLKISSPESI
jgi:pimeloyl-ACP methyl ester carboxylesterase